MQDGVDEKYDRYEESKDSGSIYEHCIKAIDRSLKFGQNGFYAYSKVLSEEKINKLIEIVKDNIDNAFDNILDAKFNINPKRVGKDNIGCSFCKYSDICFMKEEDVVLLDEHNNLDFL